MSPPAATARTTQRFDSAGTSDLVKRTCVLLGQLGVRTSSSKVSRIVHRWQEKVSHTGYPFADYLAYEVALDAEQRAALGWGLRNVFGVVDPTGQRASANVDRERGQR